MDLLYSQEELVERISNLQKVQQNRLTELANNDLQWTSLETEKNVYNKILGRVNEKIKEASPDTEPVEPPKNSVPKEK